MKNWNKPEVEITKVSATADSKPSKCEGIPTNGTCTYWTNGKPFGPCEFYDGNNCRLKKLGNVEGGTESGS